MTLNGNGKLIFWIMTGLVSLAFSATGGYLAGINKRMDQSEASTTVVQATLASRGERIAALETRSVFQETAILEIKGSLLEINRKLDALRERR